MATIERRGDGFRVRWRDPDGTARSRQCPSSRVARELLREVEDAAALGRRWEPATAPGAPLLVDLIAAYLRDLARIRAPATVQRAHAALAPFVEWVRATTGIDTPGVDALTRALVADYDAAAKARGASVATRRASAWAIGASWRWGYEHPDWRPVLAPPSLPTMPPQELPSVVAATWDQLDAVVDLARARPRAWIGRLAMLLRGLGWRVGQCLAITWEDVDLEVRTIRLRPELGKSRGERAGRTVPLAQWLAAELATWGVREGLLVGRAVLKSAAAQAITRCWRATGAPPALYQRRPDHAFRIGLVSGLTRARADLEAVEYYVGHSRRGVRGHYVDPTSLPLGEVVSLIPAPACVRGVSAEVVPLRAGRPAKRSSG